MLQSEACGDLATAISAQRLLETPGNQGYAKGRRAGRVRVDVVVADYRVPRYIENPDKLF
jgi:hypothetical protein